MQSATGGDRTSFPLVAARADSKHIDAYRLEVEFPKGPANLTVDTAASGLYISRALADLNGFEAAAGDPPGTVRVPSVKIGSLDFQDCVVGVSETPFSGKNDGFIGTDMFAQWLITLDQPGSEADTGAAASAGEHLAG